MDARLLETQITTLSFLEVESTSGRAAYVSEPYRRFAATKLLDTKQDVDDLIIRDLLSRRDDDSVSVLLPEYYHRTSRFEDLIGFLTPENFERTLCHSRSLVPVKQQVDLGVKASLALNRDSDLVRFSIHKSALLQLESTDASKAEVEARIALDDFDTAQALANAAGLKEDKLHLLAVIAKAKNKRGLTVEAELLDEIKALCGQIDSSHLGRRAVQIAADLVYSAPGASVGDGGECFCECARPRRGHCYCFPRSSCS